MRESQQNTLHRPVTTSYVGILESKCKLSVLLKDYRGNWIHKQRVWDYEIWSRFEKEPKWTSWKKNDLNEKMYCTSKQANKT